MDRKEMLKKTALIPLAAWAERDDPKPRPASADAPFNDRREGERVWDVGVHAPPKGERIVVTRADGTEVRSVRVVNWDAPYLERWRYDENGQKVLELVEERIAFTVRWSDGKTYHSASVSTPTPNRTKP